jgi:hypothetical protein
MSVLNPVIDGDSVRFDQEACAAAGRAQAAAYRDASPFPHIALPDFLPPAPLRRVASAFPEGSSGHSFSRAQEMLKTQYHPEAVPDDFSRNLIYALNTEPFIAFLTEMTCIQGLVPDPYFIGGGLHETRRGGHLGIHADFNNHKIMRLRRRLNLLVYLNDDWDESYGGHLELWSKDMKRCEKRVLPVLGSCVVFNTNLDSMHGQPDPLTCPEDRSRRSIALYYYTSTADLNDQPDRTTNFQPRANSADKKDHSVSFRHFLNEWVPPAIRRKIGRH